MKKTLYATFSAALLVISATLCTSCSDDDGTTFEPTPATQFTLDGQTIQLDTANGWATTRYNNRLALTNYAERTQYLIEWEGDSSDGEKALTSADGEKASATLTISKHGSERQTIPLSSLSIRFLNGTHYRLTFSTETIQGEIIVEM